MNGIFHIVEYIVLMFGAFIRFLLKMFYRVELRGQENLDQPEARTLILYNPGSIIDPMLISAVFPRHITVIADKAFEHKWWMRPVQSLVDVSYVDFNKEFIALDVIRILQDKKCCMVFHDRQLFNDEEYVRFLEYAGLIAFKTAANIQPIRIDGSSLSVFSYLRHRTRRRWFPKVTVTVLPLYNLDSSQEKLTKEERHRLGNHLYDMMVELDYKTSVYYKNLTELLISITSIAGKKFPIAEDQDRKILTYGKLNLNAQVIARSLKKRFAGEKYIGFLLPTSLPALVAFFAMLFAEYVPAMLNFTSGVASVLSCCRTIGIKSVLTAHKFIQLAGLTVLESALKEAGIKLIYMEDVAKELTVGDKIKGVLSVFFHYAPSTPDTDPAAIMFTSGTEGKPKAVFLSHRNFNANQHQGLSMFTLGSGDKMFNCLPMFHAFGLGICTILPVLVGVKVFLYPSPLDYRMVPKLFYESQSTILCGTDTFCAGYAKRGSAYDFCHARLVIIGAEKMRLTTKEEWKNKYGVDLFEGYGATETSPLIAVNTLTNRRWGSVGRMVPGLKYRLAPVEGINEENTGVLWVKGDSVMIGYMRASNPGVLEPPVNPDFAELDPNTDASDEGKGWYDTGDIVHIDEDGFIFIRGRAKRFAKVGGEMVSLAAVEEVIRQIWPDVPLGIVTIPDSKKGEQLALLIAMENVTTSTISAFLASKGLPQLWNPKKILNVKQVPLLGSGKFDYQTAKKMVLESMERKK